jgi:hypothetical protein
VLQFYKKLAVPSHALLWLIPDASVAEVCRCLLLNQCPHLNLPFVFDGKRRPTFALLRGTMFDCLANGLRQSPLLNATRNAQQWNLTQMTYTHDM